MRITDVLACVLVICPVLQLLAMSIGEYPKDEALNESRASIGSGPESLTTPGVYKTIWRQFHEDRNLTLPQRSNKKVRRRKPCFNLLKCYRRRVNSKNYPKVDNRGPIKRSRSRNAGFKAQFGRKRDKNFKHPKLKTKSLPLAFRRSRFRDDLDSVSMNMYGGSYEDTTLSHIKDGDQNSEFFNVMQTFFDNQNAYDKKFPYGKRKSAKGSWLSGGYDIDSTLDLVSTKSTSNTYRDYDDEYQKSLSSVYQDYHNPLRHSLVNLLTELFVTLNNSSLSNDYEVVSRLATENMEISESANDFCQRWIDHKDKLEAVFLGPSTRLPSCPCFYPSNIFYNDKIWDKKQQKNFRWRDSSGKSQRMDIYKPGAFYCVRSLLTQGSGSAAAQHCCYDQERRLITRGSGAGTPNFVSPEASQVLHEKIDLLPWQLCKGDFSRFNSMRPPNNDNNCQMNPDEEEYQRQKAEKKAF